MKRVFASKTVNVFLIVFVLICFLFIGFNKFYIDLLWFKEVRYTQVFLREIISKIQIGIPLFIIMTFILFSYFKFLSNAINKSALIIRYSPSNKTLLLFSSVISLFISLIVTNTLWYKLLEFIYAENFNITDPLFNKDISFYIFKLPFLENLFYILIGLWVIVAFSTLLFTLIMYGLNPNRSINLGDNRTNFKSWMKDFNSFLYKEIGIFASLFFLIIAFYFYLQNFRLLYSTSGITYGASYTDVKVALPINIALIILSIILSILSINSNLRRKIKIYLISFILLIIVFFSKNLIITGVGRFVVAPNEYAKEEKYIMRNIEATQTAYGLDQVLEKDFVLNLNMSLDDINKNRVTIDNIPINDYRPTLDMFNSIQGFRPYYEFKDIDIDRYYIEDKYTQVFISAREMNNLKLNDNAQNWINTHLKYTHGYGVAVAPVNTVNETGQPYLIVKDIPPDTAIDSLKITEPRIYFGESTNTYAITNAKSKEFDYPQGSENIENYYDGNAGIKMNFLNRLAFSIYHGDFRIMLSSDIQSDSKMLIRRNIIDRVYTIAPFLTYDEDPYIVIADGKLYWIIDGFTLSDRYPYSTPYSEEEKFNYIRNSVKIVIDAYNGDVDFYQVDKEDPIINVYNKIYKGMFKPIEDMPSSIKKHIRYSQAMFDIQANMYRIYHMDNPQVFYNREDEWDIATQMYGQDKEVESVESAYLIMKQPEENSEEFVLMVPYTPKNRDNMIAWMAAMNDEEQYGELVVYKFPKHNLVYGPMQIEQRIDQDTVISPQLTLLGQQGSKITRGNMLTIPVSNSILYVEPIYVESSSEGSKIPEVKKVIVSYNNKIVMDDNLHLALEALFGEKEEEITPNQTDTSHDIKALIDEANRLLDSMQKAQQAGEKEKFKEYLEQLKELLENM